MSQNNIGADITLKANDTSCPAYRVVAPGNVGNLYAGVWDVATDKILGVSQENASSTGEAWSVRLYGTTKITCGASVSAGSLCTPQSVTGKVIEATDAYATVTSTIERIIGVALEAGSTNSVIQLLINIRNVRRVIP